MAPHSIDLLDAADCTLADGICIAGIKSEVYDLVWRIGGPAKAAKLIGCKYSRLREWPLGRRPIPLPKLNSLLSACDGTFARKIKGRILRRDLVLKVQYSPHAANFPKFISPELAYVVGIILGDGSLAGATGNKRGDWRVSVCFDNFEHLMIYERLIAGLFGFKPKRYFSDKNYYESYFSSKAVHWFLRSFFKIKNGVKHDSIRIPKRIFYSDGEVLAACVRGLFDSDGTVLSNRNEVKYSSTSKPIIRQLQSFFRRLGIKPTSDKWLKNGNSKMLYSIRLRRGDAILKFAQVIGFRHPGKKARLGRIVGNLTANSPVV